ncbi:hypothetical protein I6G82_05730 [Lysinibacillus macroides]|uniref:Methylamine utilisation protein MauE domain-containing protein n=1 Tax=Lysinibacillus macroides TaxID=33935 RepID=A0A0N0CWJ4_9BACI|nr:hypothetical protein ADM90_08220 [Lysinibacillus macroides]QPR69113.1 hypothetical protein I6G82_05730 [Lysinibacillus macroides]
MDSAAILTKVVSIPLGLLFLKSSISKLRKPYQLYLAFESYNFFKEQKILRIVVSFFLSLEVILSLGLLYPVNLKIILSLGIFLQSIYLLIMIMNINKSFSNNCGCFPLNVPKEVSLKNLLTI